MNIKCSSQCTLFPLPTRGMEEVETARKEQEKLSSGGENKEKLSKKMFRVV